MMQQQTGLETIDIPLREFYVYALVDPRDDNIFYVGKGQRERILHHAGQVVLERDRADNEDQSNKEAARTEKEQRIAEIKIAGLTVIERVLARFDTEGEAYAVESVLIHWVYGRKQEGRILTNVQAGHNQSHVRRKGNLDKYEYLDVAKKLRSEPGVYGRTSLQRLLDNQIPTIAVETVQQLRTLLPGRMTAAVLRNHLLRGRGRLGCEPAALRQGRVRRLPRVRCPGARFPALSLRRLRRTGSTTSSPNMPLRQRVLALPILLRHWLAAQPKVVTPALQVVRHVLMRFLPDQAG